MAQSIPNFVIDIRNRLAKANQLNVIIDLVQEVLTYLEGQSNYRRIANGLIHLSGRLHQLKYEENSGLRSPEYLNRTKNQCTNSFLGFLEDLKSSAPVQTEEPIIAVPNKKIKVFLSYSHQDEALKEELDIALSGLKRSDKIATWNDRMIRAGDLWDDKIKQALQEADLALFLISANFLASDYIWDNELLPAIERHKQGLTRVVPLFMRPCYWEEMPFAKFQGFPTDAKAVTSFANKDEAYVDIARGLAKLVDELQGKV